VRIHGARDTVEGYTPYPCRRLIGHTGALLGSFVLHCSKLIDTRPLLTCSSRYKDVLRRVIFHRRRGLCSVRFDHGTKFAQGMCGNTLVCGIVDGQRCGAE
jgi:hypothetical protein